VWCNACNDKNNVSFWFSSSSLLVVGCLRRGIFTHGSNTRKNNDRVASRVNQARQIQRAFIVALKLKSRQIEIHGAQNQCFDDGFLNTIVIMLLLISVWNITFVHYCNSLLL
jgi:hypothetical protein